MKMHTKVLTFVALIAGLLTVGAPLFAHHGDAAYNPAPLELKGAVVTEFNVDESTLADQGRLQDR